MLELVKEKWPFWAIGLAAAILLGGALRLVWVEDMEFKADEAWTFKRTQQIGETEAWPWLGMQSSTELPNPGMSLWVFVGLAKLVGAHEPTTLARAVQVLNIGALLVLVWFALRIVPRPEREPWLWAAALVALNPLAIEMHRKIWPPSILPILTMIMLSGWWYRDRRWGGFLWGLIGMCIGQIHMSGFFLLGGFALWTGLFDRQKCCWRTWFAGVALGALPAIPWLWSMLTAPGSHINHTRWYHAVESKFWLRWLTEPFGLGVSFALDRDFVDFLTYPLIAGRPTYLMLVLHVLLIVIGTIVLLRFGYQLWQDRREALQMWLGQSSTTAFMVSASLWGFGILLTLSNHVPPQIAFR